MYKGICDNVKNGLVIGAEYVLIDRVKNERDDRWHLKRLKVRLVRLYPHLAAFEDKNGLLRTFSYWELWKMREEKKFFAIRKKSGKVDVK